MSPQPQASAAPNELDAALEYARNGIPVFPCNPLDKKPLTARGFKDAVTDEAQIRAWWAKWPNAMIGAPTGSASGMWVLDVDKDPVRNVDGMAALMKLIAQHGELPETLMAITPRGGRHLFFAWSNGIDIRNSTGKLGRGLDVRGNGGYVCLPPSRRADGALYQWERNNANKVVDAPDWLTELVRKRPQGWARTALEQECEIVAAAKPGTRNNALNRAAFNLFQIVAGGGLNEQEVRDALFEAAEACGLVADDGAAQVWATIDSGAQAGRARPRTRPITAAPQAQQPTGRPIIQLKAGEQPRIAAEAESALRASELPIFSRADMLMRPVHQVVAAADGRKTMITRLHQLSSRALQLELANAAIFQNYNRRRQQWIAADCPLPLAQMLLARGYWDIPYIRGIATTPTLRADGSLLATPGYDPQTQFYLLSDLSLPAIPAQPTREDAERALEQLSELFSEFAFVDRALDHAVALAALLTTLIRSALAIAPMVLVHAHVSGTGKSYLVDLIATVATGRDCPVIALAASKDENAKCVGAMILGGAPIISFDNCNCDLDDASLFCHITERPRVSIRVLGRSEAPECEVTSAVFATGNNIAVKGQLIRRTLRCKLDAVTERPELRRFKKNALGDALANRSTYVAAALTIVRAYLAAGAPEVCGPLGSYPAWSRMVRSPLIWLGQPDPFKSTEQTREEDSELADIREFFALWLGSDLKLDYHYATARIIEVACERSAGFNPPVFKQFLLRVAASRVDATVISHDRLGWWLRGISGRIVDDHRLVMGRLNKASACFRLVKVTT
jgi:hypothetical protein